MTDLGPNDMQTHSAQPQTTDAAKKKEKKKKTLGREILEWVLTIAVAIALALVIRTFVFEPVRVDGSSMINTLHHNEFMVVTKYDYLFDDPERFDVVVCYYPGGDHTYRVKRVVGIPGDTVAMRNGVLYVNGEAVEESYIGYPANYEMAETVVEEGHYFVLGDNRASSKDSHVSTVGQIPREDIKGHVRLVIYPFNAIRTIQ